METIEVVRALENKIQNKDSNGRGYDPNHDKNPFHDTIASYGCFEYSHSKVRDSIVPVIEHVYRSPEYSCETYSIFVQEFKSFRSMRTQYFQYELTGPCHLDHARSFEFYRDESGEFCDADDIHDMRFSLDTHAFKVNEARRAEELRKTF